MRWGLSWEDRQDGESCWWQQGAFCALWPQVFTLHSKVWLIQEKERKLSFHGMLWWAWENHEGEVDCRMLGFPRQASSVAGGITRPDTVQDSLTKVFNPAPVSLCCVMDGYALSWLLGLETYALLAMPFWANFLTISFCNFIMKGPSKLHLIARINIGSNELNVKRTKHIQSTNIVFKLTFYLYLQVCTLKEIFRIQQSCNGLC